MTRRARSLVLPVVLLFALGGCGGAGVAPSGAGGGAAGNGGGAQVAGVRRSVDSVAAGRSVVDAGVPQPYLIVGSNDAVFVDSLPNAKPVRSITKGIQGAVALAVDGKNDLFVANQNQTITEYTPPYSAAPAATIAYTRSTVPFPFSCDPQGDLAVSANATPAFQIFEPPYTAAPIDISIPAGQLDQLTVDANRNVLVLATGGDLPGRVYEYAAPYTSAPTEPIANLPGGSVLAIDPEGNLWIAGVHFLYEYAPPYTAAPLVTYTEPSSGTYLQDPVGIAFSGKRDNVDVLNNDSAPAIEYVWPPPYTTPSGINRSVNLYYGSNTVGTQTSDLWGVSERNHGSALGLVRWTGNFSGAPTIYDVGQTGESVGDAIPLLITGPVAL